MNVIPAGFTQGTSPDLEVDFGDIARSATAIVEPSNFLVVPTGLDQAMISWEPDNTGWILQPKRRPLVRELDRFAERVNESGHCAGYGPEGSLSIDPTMNHWQTS